MSSYSAAASAGASAASTEPPFCSQMALMTMARLVMGASMVPRTWACRTSLEGSKRGIYGGAIGYIDLTGNMDTCISIRIAYKKNGTVYIRSGAGIVADSVPEKEHTECINKAMAVVQAVRESAGDAQ